MLHRQLCSEVYTVKWYCSSEKNLLFHKYCGYLNETNTCVFTIISSIVWDRCFLCCTVVTQVTSLSAIYSAVLQFCRINNIAIYALSANNSAREITFNAFDSNELNGIAFEEISWTIATWEAVSNGIKAIRHSLAKMGSWATYSRGKCQQHCDSVSPMSNMIDFTNDSLARHTRSSG